ncbi:MAG: transposase [Marinilabiliaceae bacterium]|nr:transposase [Marinilabiliaceae bacterium]
MNNFNPNIHHRRSFRLKGYDYSKAGFYFVTICCQNNVHRFGTIENGAMILNKYGQIVQMVWNELPQHYPNVQLGEFVVMPNHIHGIIIISYDNIARNVGAGFKPAPTQPAPTHGLSEIVRGLKTFSARKINELRNSQGEKLWQRNYWENIIRNEQAYQYIANYIINNPANWDNDRFY